MNYENSTRACARVMGINGLSWRNQNPTVSRLKSKRVPKNH